MKSRPQIPEKYDKLLKEAEKELYANCEVFFNSTTIVKLMHMKVECIYDK